MKPGLLDICAIILSLAMAVILAFDVVAPRERWLVQWAGREASVKNAERSAPLHLNRSRPCRSVSPNGWLSRDADFSCADRKQDFSDWRDSRSTACSQLPKLDGLVLAAGQRGSAIGRE